MTWHVNQFLVLEHDVQSSWSFWRIFLEPILIFQCMITQLNTVLINQTNVYMEHLKQWFKNVGTASRKRKLERKYLNKSQAQTNFLTSGSRGDKDTGIFLWRIDVLWNLHDFQESWVFPPQHFPFAQLSCMFLRIWQPQWLILLLLPFSYRLEEHDLWRC